MSIARPLGEGRIEEGGQISVPADSLRELGWELGNQVLVHRVGETIVLMRRPTDWTEAFSSKMGDVWGDHEDTRHYLDEERASWDRPIPGTCS